MVIPNHFGKHVNRTSHIKIVIYKEKTMLLEKDKFLSRQKDVAQIFNKHFGSTTDSSNLFSWSEDTKMSPGNDTINSIIKKCAFHQSIKAIKTIKRIINDLDIKKPSSGEIPT